MQISTAVGGVESFSWALQSSSKQTRRLAPRCYACALALARSLLTPAVLVGVLTGLFSLASISACTNKALGSDDSGSEESAQDADGSACTAIEEATTGVIDTTECWNQRTISHQRGVCLAKSPGVQLCPLDLSDEQKLANGIPLDDCAQLNAEMSFVCG